MHTKITLLMAAVVALGPISAAAPRLQPPDEQEGETTPCEAKAIEIVERATTYSERANATSIPQTKTDNAARSCGILLQGIDTLRGMSCPAELVDLMVKAQKSAQASVDRLNEVYEYRFNCDSPQYRYASSPGLGFRSPT